MRLTGFQVDGFGTLANQGVPDLPAGLVLFVGESEGGEAALKQFIRFVLFGFPRRGSRNGFVSLAGGNSGGRLEIELRDGRQFTIERTSTHEELLGADGTTLPIARLTELLGAVDRPTYEAIYAVDLDCVPGLEATARDGVSARVFAAGAGLGAVSVPGAVRQLEAEAGGLLGPRAGPSLISRTIHRVSEIEARLEPLRRQGQEYAANRAQLQQLAARIAENRTLQDAVREKLRRIGQLGRAREPWLQLCAARATAARLEFARNFPADGVPRLASLTEQLDQVNQEIVDRQSALARTEALQHEFKVDELLLQHRPEIEALARERDKLAVALVEHPVVTRRLGLAQQELERRRQELGAGWDCRALPQVDPPAPARLQTQALGRLIVAVERRVEQTEARQRSRTEDETESRRRAEREQPQLDRAPVPEITDARQIRDRQEALRLVRISFQRQEASNALLDARRTVRQSLLAQLESLRRQAELKPIRLPRWAAVGSLFLCEVTGIVSVARRLYFPAALAFAAGMLVVAAFTVLRRRQADWEATRLSRLEVDRKRFEASIQSVAGEIETLEAQLAQCASEIDQTLKGVGIARPGDAAQLDRLTAQLEAAAAQSRERDAQRQRSDAARAGWRRDHERLARAEQEVVSAAARLTNLQDQWRKRLAEQGFPDTIRPEEFAATLHAVDSARIAEQTLAELQARQRQIQEYLTGISERVSNLLGKCRRAPLSAAVGTQDIDRLIGELRDALAKLRKKETLTEETEACRSAISQLSGRRDARQQELNQLLAEAHAADVAEFRLTAASREEWLAGSRQAEAAELALRAIAGSPEAQLQLESELSSTDPHELLAEQDQLQAQDADLMANLTADEQAVGALTERLARMEQDERLGGFLRERAGLLEQLADSIRRWAIAVITRHLLEQACSTYECERQPAIIQEADRFLATMTNTRYRLLLSPEERVVQLQDASRHRPDETAGGRGLADQVYLATRLALAQEFGRHAEPLPVTMGDVLEKLAPEGQAGVARVILDFARGQQVLLFTCHPEREYLIRKTSEEAQFCDVPVSCYALTNHGIRKRSL
jgi:uncharacterized protein YhaN